MTIGSSQEILCPHDHTLGIFPSRKKELEFAASFLKDGLKKNEITMLISDYLKKDDIRKILQEKWYCDVRELEANEIFLLESTTEWYFGQDPPNAEKIWSKWKDIMRHAKRLKAKGLRVFADMSTFFECGYNDNAIYYESTLPPSFGIPLNAICAYTYKNMDTLTPHQFHILKDHHNKILM